MAKFDMITKTNNDLIVMVANKVKYRPNKDTLVIKSKDDDNYPQYMSMNNKQIVDQIDEDDFPLQPPSEVVGKYCYNSTDGFYLKPN